MFTSLYSIDSDGSYIGSVVEFEPWVTANSRTFGTLKYELAYRLWDYAINNDLATVPNHKEIAPFVRQVERIVRNYRKDYVINRNTNVAKLPPVKAIARLLKGVRNDVAFIAD